ncbi:F-box protein [Cardamine amara subsp. amara]|uniref:F-box protein n=1 Tax=Cardamine amara subsp. amara TaxID=228776 RepID=A0ABD1AE05_CARAN
MWVLEDVEKQEWSKYVYTLPEHEVFGSGAYLSIARATAIGEIVFYKKFMSKGKPFYVFYFNPERNTLLSVEIQGVEIRGRVYLVVDYVEDLSIKDAKLLKSSIYEEEAQPKYHYQKRPKPQHREEVRGREGKMKTE